MKSVNFVFGGLIVICALLFMGGNIYENDELKKSITKLEERYMSLESKVDNINQEIKLSYSNNYSSWIANGMSYYIIGDSQYERENSAMNFYDLKTRLQFMDNKINKLAQEQGLEFSLKEATMPTLELNKV